MKKFKFNSRKTKPKIFNVLILSVVFVLFLFAYWISKPFDVYYLAYVFAAYLITVIIFLIDVFIKQLEYNPYSYNSIYYLSFAIFVSTVLVTTVYFIFNYMYLSTTPNFNGFYSLLFIILDSAKYYMLYSSPVVMVISIILVISNIILIKKEGFGFPNSLGIILAFFLIGGLIFMFISNYYVSGSFSYVVFHEVLTNSFAAIYLYFECMIFGTALVDLIVTRYKPDYDADYIIILGCGIDEKGIPYPLLASRIECADRFYLQQKTLNNKELIFITSGGQGQDEVVSESMAMKNYLTGKGINEDQIIMEDRSFNTRENMRNSKRIIDERDPEAKVLFSTSDFHVFRSGLMARREKLKAIGIGAKTKWYFFPNAIVREFVGLLTQHKGKQIAVILGMILIYIIETLLIYNL